MHQCKGVNEDSVCMSTARGGFLLSQRACVFAEGLNIFIVLQISKVQCATLRIITCE